MSRKPAAYEEVPVDPYEAFAQVVKSFGVAEMAAELMVKKGTLYNKVDADDTSHAQPTLRDVVRVTQASGDMRILDCLNRRFNRASYDVTPGLAVSDEALLELLCRVGSDSGELHKALNQSLADGRFCREDLQRVRGEAHDLITSVLVFVHRLEGLVDE